MLLLRTLILDALDNLLFFTINRVFDQETENHLSIWRCIRNTYNDEIREINYVVEVMCVLLLVIILFSDHCARHELI